MRKPASKKALLKEEAFWSGLKKAAAEKPAKVCRK
jgi:hypothetical protein